MEDTQTIAPEAVLDTQPESVESSPTESQPSQASAGKSENKSGQLAQLLKKEKENPDIKFTDSELDVLDQYYDGKLKPSDSKPVNPTKSDAEESDDSISETEEQAEETESNDEQKNDSKLDPETEAAMKEVGAKDVKELVDKIKGLKSAIGGKDAQAVAKLTKEVENLQTLQKNELKLWEDAKNGVPQAVDIMKRRGILQESPQQRQEQSTSESIYIDPDKFIDPESADLVNQAFQRQADE